MVDLFYSQFKINKKTTCGLDGETFLQWSVALSESRILPNGFDWFLFTAFPFIFYKPRPMGLFMMFYLILTFAIPFALVSLGEAASIFCWLGVGIFVVFMLEPYMHMMMRKKFPMLLDFEIPFISKIEKFFETKLDEKEQVVNDELDLNERKLEKDEDMKLPL